jgi:proteasome lid subunit RPN8/RPN11
MKLMIRSDCLRDAREFFEAAGAHGREGTGLLLAEPGANTLLVTRFIAPDQITGSDSCWVEVTLKGKLELAAALAPNELIAARVHSHPGEAFHSSVDDRNPGLTAEGYWSIVVPYYGLGLRRGISACAVYKREEGKWRRLISDEVTDQISIIL